MNEKQINREILDQVDASRRASVRKILAGSFVLPAVATFSMSAMTMKAANAGVANGSALPPEEE